MRRRRRGWLQLPATPWGVTTMFRAAGCGLSNSNLVQLRLASNNCRRYDQPGAPEMAITPITALTDSA